MLAAVSPAPVVGLCELELHIKNAATQLPPCNAYVK
jgi:hypothetical protein